MDKTIEQQAREILAMEMGITAEMLDAYDGFRAPCRVSVALRAIARALTRPAPSDEEVEVEYEFQVMQDDCLQASGCAPSPEEAAKEADHYALMYGQDSPVEVVFYKRIRMARAALGVG